jgi:hypothetical protein
MAKRVITRVEYDYGAGVFRDHVSGTYGFMKGRAPIAASSARRRKILREKVAQAFGKTLRGPTTRSASGVKLNALKEKARKLAVQHHGQVAVPRHDSKGGVWVSSPDVRAMMKHLGVRWPVVVAFAALREGLNGRHDSANGCHLIGRAQEQLLGRQGRPRAGGRRGHRRAVQEVPERRVPAGQGAVVNDRFVCPPDCVGGHRLGRGAVSCERFALWRQRQSERMLAEMADPKGHDRRYDPESAHREGVLRHWRTRSRAPEDNPMHGRRHRPESIKKMSRAKRGSRNPSSAA